MTKVKVKLDNFEIRVVINSLHQMRNNLISENKEVDLVDDILIKYLDLYDKIK